MSSRISGSSMNGGVNRRGSDTHVLQSMQAAAELAHKRRFRITICTTVAASVPFVVCIVIFWLQALFFLNPYEVGFNGLYEGTVAWTGLVMLLGVMPNDSMLIRALGFLLMNAAIGTGMLCTGSWLYAWFGNPLLYKENESDPDFYICATQADGEVYNIGCGLYMVRYMYGSIFLFGTALAFSATIRRHKNAVVYDRTKPKGFRYNDAAFVMPARAALDRLWISLRWVCFLPIGVFYIIYACFSHFWDCEAPWYSDLEFAADLFFGIMWVLACLFFTHDRRRTIMGFLSAINTQGEADSAAAMAALLGGRGAQDSLNLAKRRFRSISFSDLTAEDFKENTKDQKNNLFSKTTETNLGSCDAFISHSWSDNGVTKFERLKAWADNFIAENKRPPTVWLDKACIDQSDISANLLCLPVFAAGCEKLLILAGKTYCERLWCIIEVFVFLRMGGDLDRLVVLPIEQESEEDAQSRFESVDASHCKCALESDRQKLLGVVEQGFGNFNEFNTILRHVFRKRLNNAYMV
eukprot:gene596-1015_t